MNLLPLATMLEGLGLGTMGEDIFVNMMPTECERGVLLRQPLTGTKIDYELPEYFKTTIQVIVRARDFEDGKTLIKAVVDALYISSDMQLENMWIRYLRPNAKPVSFPVSEGNFIEFVVPMDTCYNDGDE